MVTPSSKAQSEKLKQLRNDTTTRILNSRRFMGIYHCPVCMKPLNGSGELHEVMLTRGDVQFAKDEDKLLIHVPQNCTVLHPGDCHHAAQHTEEGKIACLRQMVFFEGYNELHEWLTEIAFALRSRIPVDKCRCLIEHRTVIEKLDELYLRLQ